MSTKSASRTTKTLKKAFLISLASNVALIKFSSAELDVHALFEIQLNLKEEEEGIIGNDKVRVRNDKSSEKQRYDG